MSQLDLEMAFAKEEDIIKVIEALIKKLWSRYLGVSLQQTPFDRLSYEDAMQSYGSDKPDRRIDMKVWFLHGTWTWLIITDKSAA